MIADVNIVFDGARKREVLAEGRGHACKAPGLPPRPMFGGIGVDRLVHPAMNGAIRLGIAFDIDMADKNAWRLDGNFGNAREHRVGIDRPDDARHRHIHRKDAQLHLTFFRNRARSDRWRLSP